MFSKINLYMFRETFGKSSNFVKIEIESCGLETFKVKGEKLTYKVKRTESIPVITMKDLSAYFIVSS